MQPTIAPATTHIHAPPTFSTPVRHHANTFDIHAVGANVTQLPANVDHITINAQNRNSDNALSNCSNTITSTAATHLQTGIGVVSSPFISTAGSIARR